MNKMEMLPTKKEDHRLEISEVLDKKTEPLLEMI